MQHRPARSRNTTGFIQRLNNPGLVIDSHQGNNRRTLIEAHWGADASCIHWHVVDKRTLGLQAVYGIVNTGMLNWADNNLVTPASKCPSTSQKQMIGLGRARCKYDTGWIPTNQRRYLLSSQLHSDSSTLAMLVNRSDSQGRRTTAS